MRIVGPNCLGFICRSYNGSFAHGTPKKGEVAMISQSGAMLTGMLDYSMGQKTKWNVLVGSDPMIAATTGFALKLTSGREFVREASANSVGNYARRLVDTYGVVRARSNARKALKRRKILTRRNLVNAGLAEKGPVIWL